MKAAIAINTKERLELTRQTIKPLLRQPFDLFWMDGSDTREAQAEPFHYGIPPAGFIFSNVIGGAGMGMVFALDTMLKHPTNYTHVGLCENDTLLPQDWFEPTMALFEQGAIDGLDVGAVSARCYEDRVLIQRDGYALCHNLGAGHIVFTREAAKIILQTFRSAWTVDNRRIFEHLSGIDIGQYWAFRQAAQFLTADWHWEAALATRGLAALALTPSHVEMIGQDPPLAEQGLVIAQQPVDLLRNDKAFERFCTNTERLRDGTLALAIDPVFHRDPDSGTHTYFAHQLACLDGAFSGNWVAKDLRRIGPLTWIAEEGAGLSIPLAGSVSFMVTGGDKGAKLRVEDETGFSVEPVLPPEHQAAGLLCINLPGAIGSRQITLTALTAGVRLYGVQSREPQCVNPSIEFSWESMSHD